jgi:membrane dipeptidase
MQVLAPIVASPPRAVASPRAVDGLDRLFASQGAVDLHADTPLHDRPLDDDQDDPGFWMRVWIGIVTFLGWILPFLRNFFRHVTRDSLRRRGRGLQVFSIVTQGFPPAWRGSHQAYTRLVANWPAVANATEFNAFLYQAAWAHREVGDDPDHLAFSGSLKDTRASIEQGRVAVQLGVEGAFPLTVTADDEVAFAGLVAEGVLPKDFPLPSQEERATLRGRLHYMKRLGVSYIGLNHLNSSCFAGSDLWLADNKGKGLSQRGRRVLREMDRAGILLDLSHASHQAQRDVAKLVAEGRMRLPVLVSHGSIAKAGQSPNWRQTVPEALEAVKATGGVVGVIFASVYLENGKVSDIVDQIDAVRDRIGIDHVAFGSDADGFVGLPFPDLAEGFASIIAEMRRRGYCDEDILKVRGGNYLHALERRDRILEHRAGNDVERSRRNLIGA